MIDDKDRERLHDWIDGRLSESEAREFASRVATDRELSIEHAELTRLVSQLSSLRGERAPTGFAAAVVAAANRSSAGDSPAGSAHTGGAPRIPAWVTVTLPIAATLLIGVFAFRYVAIERLEATAPTSPRVQLDDSSGTAVPPHFEDDKKREMEASEGVKLDSPRSALKPAAAAEAPVVDRSDDDEAMSDTEESKRGGSERVETKKSTVARGTPERDRLSDARGAAEEVGVATGSAASEVAAGEISAWDSVVTVWRVKRATPPIEDGRLAKASPGGRADRRLPVAEVNPSDPTENLPIPDELRASIDSIRAEAPDRVQLVALDDAKRAEFLADAARSGYVVLEFVATPPSSTSKDEWVGQDEPAASSARLAVFARAESWKTLMPAASEADPSKNAVASKGKTDKYEARGGPESGGSGPTASGGGPTTPGGGPGAVVGGGGGGASKPGTPGFGAKPGSAVETPSTSGGATPVASEGKKLAQELEDGESTKQGMRVLIVYEFDPPR